MSTLIRWREAPLLPCQPIAFDNGHPVSIRRAALGLAALFRVPGQALVAGEVVTDGRFQLSNKEKGVTHRHSPHLQGP